MTQSNHPCPHCAPVEQDPEPAPDTPVFPPPGADGDRDEEEPTIEPDWQDFNRDYLTLKRAGLSPEEFQRLYVGRWVPPEEPESPIDWQDDLRAYHSHLCPCPACADAEARRYSRIQSQLHRNSQW